MSLKIRVCDNSHSKLYINVRFAVHTLYMMHPMLNYSHSNPVDTHLKNQLVKDNRFFDNAKNCDNFEFSHDESKYIYLYCFLSNA